MSLHTRRGPPHHTDRPHGLRLASNETYQDFYNDISEKMHDEGGSPGLDPEVPASPIRGLESKRASSCSKANEDTKGYWRRAKVYEDIFNSPDTSLTPPGTPIDFSSPTFGSDWYPMAHPSPSSRIVDCAPGSPHTANVSFTCLEDTGLACSIEDVYELSHPLRHHVARQLKRFRTRVVKEFVKEVGGNSLGPIGETGVMEEGGVESKAAENLFDVTCRNRLESEIARPPAVLPIDPAEQMIQESYQPRQPEPLLRSVANQLRRFRKRELEREDRTPVDERDTGEGPSGLGERQSGEEMSGAVEVSGEEAVPVLQDNKVVQPIADDDQDEYHSTGPSTCLLNVERIFVCTAPKVLQEAGTLHCPWVRAIDDLCPCGRPAMMYESHGPLADDCSRLPFLPPPHDRDALPIESSNEPERSSSILRYTSFFEDDEPHQEKSTSPHRTSQGRRAFFDKFNLQTSSSKYFNESLPRSPKEKLQFNLAPLVKSMKGTWKKFTRQGKENSKDLDREDTRLATRNHHGVQFPTSGKEAVKSA